MDYRPSGKVAKTGHREEAQARLDGVLVKLRRQAHAPLLPSVFLVSTTSRINKMDKERLQAALYTSLKPGFIRQFLTQLSSKHATLHTGMTGPRSPVRPEEADYVCMSTTAGAQTLRLLAATATWTWSRWPIYLPQGITADNICCLYTTRC